LLTYSLLVLMDSWLSGDWSIKVMDRAHSTTHQSSLGLRRYASCSLYLLFVDFSWDFSQFSAKPSSVYIKHFELCRTEDHGSCTRLLHDAILWSV